MILAPAIAFFVSYGLDRGFGPWEVTLLAALWVAPMLTRPIAAAFHVPLGLLTIIAFFLLVLRRAAHDTDSALLLLRPGAEAASAE